jgi:hypothetical protein
MHIFVHSCCCGGQGCGAGVKAHSRFMPPQFSAAYSHRFRTLQGQRGLSAPKLS